MAFEPTWLPGGAEVKAAVAARRGQTELSKLALSMKPGTWAELKTEQPARLWSSPRWKGGRNAGGAGGLHIAGWTDDAHWCSRTGQFMVDPQTGRYLIWAGSRGKPKNLYEFDSDKNEYRLIESARAGYPFRRFAMPVMAFIPEYGVIMWAERQVFLYKHDPNGDYPVVEQEPEGEE